MKWFNLKKLKEKWEMLPWQLIEIKYMHLNFKKKKKKSKINLNRNIKITKKLPQQLIEIN